MNSSHHIVRSLAAGMVAMLLVAPGGDGVRRVVFANVAARKLLHGGWKLEGQDYDSLLSASPVESRTLSSPRPRVISPEARP